jgi:hypothetical protein
MKDLADYPYPLTDLFAQPTSSEQWDRYRLSQEQIDFFHENGYLAGVQLLEEKQIHALDQALDEVNLVTVERAWAPQARRMRGVVGERAEARDVRSRVE